MYNIVTSVTPNFLPGLVALHNSIKRNMPSATLHCFYFGEEDVELPEGITYYKNIEMYGDCYAVGEQYREGLILGNDMYARLMLPKYFEGRVMYLDVDCLVLQGFQELYEMDFQGMPTACVFRPDIGWKGGNGHDDMASGTFMADVGKWREQKIMEDCFEVMNPVDQNKFPRFSKNVESVMSFVHNGKFLHISGIYQNLTYYGSLTSYDKIAHFAGPKPWHIEGRDTVRTFLNYEVLWRAYYRNNEQLIQELTNKLPAIRRGNYFERIQDTTIQ